MAGRRLEAESPEMITVANRLYVKAEYADAFETVFRGRAGLVDKMEGFVSNQILRPGQPGRPDNPLQEHLDICTKLVVGCPAVPRRPSRVGRGPHSVCARRDD